MLKICTVYFKGLYSPDYVSNIYRSLKKHSSVPFEFICLSDTTDIEADVILPYNHHSDVVKHWHKLKFFSPQFAYQNLNDDIIIMDIDQIIVNNIDDLLKWPVKENELLTYGQWWNTKLKSDGKINTETDKVILPFNGGFYKFKSGSLKFIWDDFIKNPNYWQLHFYNIGEVHAKYYGEQNYVFCKLLEYKSKIITTPEKWIATYTDNYNQNLELNKLYAKKFNTDYMIFDNVNDNIKIVHFSGVNKKINISKHKFIEENWYGC